MKKLYIFIALFLTSGIAFAQSDADVLRFSRTLPLGTARSAAMSGAFGALGGDISTLNVNPAGIGVFRKSEVSMTLSPDFGNTKSGGQTAHDNSFQLGDIGFVISLYNPNFDWKGINFGINYTNMNNFNRHTTQAIPNAPNSFPVSGTGYKRIDSLRPQPKPDSKSGRLLQRPAMDGNPK